jgi:hypothetical protein
MPRRPQESPARPADWPGAGLSRIRPFSEISEGIRKPESAGSVRFPRRKAAPAQDLRAKTGFPRERRLRAAVAAGGGGPGAGREVGILLA